MSVSELLAGVPSDPGRSPGAARVRGFLTTPAGTAPDPHDTEQPVRVPSWDQAIRNIILTREAVNVEFAQGRIFLIVIAGLDPAIPMMVARPCLPKRDARDKRGHDDANTANIT